MVMCNAPALFRHLKAAVDARRARHGQYLLTGSQKFASLGAHLLAGQITVDRWKDELVPLIKEMGKAIELASICGLGRSVPMPLLTVLNFFPDDVASHLVAATAKEAHP